MNFIATIEGTSICETLSPNAWLLTIQVETWKVQGVHEKVKLAYAEQNASSKEFDTGVKSPSWVHALSEMVSSLY